MLETEVGAQADDDVETAPRTGERGFALAAAVVLILVVGTLAAAGMNLSSFELDSSRDFQADTRAFYVADRGLNRYLAEDADDLTPSVTYTFQNGQATVQAHRLVAGMEDHELLYRISSRGEYTTPSGETASRTVTTTVLATPLMPVFPSGAFVTGGKLNQNGNSAVFDGTDGYAGGDTQCSAADVGAGTGVSGLVADSFEVSGGGGGGGAGGGGGGACDNSGTVLPNPPGAECRSNATSEFMSAQQWRTLKNMDADHTIRDGDAFPQTDGFEVVKVDGNYSLSSGARTGQGILIVDGNFTTNGNFEWDGLVLVGGKLAASNGTEEVRGGIATGLDELLGENVPSTNIGNGTKTFKYNSCNVYKASTSKYRVTRVPATVYESR